MLDILVFVDVDWAGDPDQRRSISGYVFNLFGGAISWMSKNLLVDGYEAMNALTKVLSLPSKYLNIGSDVT